MTTTQKLFESFRITWPVLLAFIGGVLWTDRQFTLLQLSLDSAWTYEDALDYAEWERTNNPNLRVPDPAMIHRKNHPRPKILGLGDSLFGAKP